MRFSRLNGFTRHDPGFGLIDLIIGLAVSSIIGVGLTATIIQTLEINNWSLTRTTVEHQVQNVGQWITYDIRMAQAVTPSEGTGFPLTIAYQEQDGTAHEVIYTISGGEMKRQHSVNQGAAQETLVSLYLDAATTTFTQADGIYHLSVNATVGSGASAGTETRVFQIYSRWSAAP